MNSLRLEKRRRFLDPIARGSGGGHPRINCRSSAGLGLLADGKSQTSALEQEIEVVVPQLVVVVDSARRDEIPDLRLDLDGEVGLLSENLAKGRHRGVIAHLKRALIA